MVQTRKILLATAALAVAFGCYSPPTQVASRYVKSVALTAGEGGTITISEEESPELAGLTLEIAPGALAYDEVITVEVGEATIASDSADSAGPVAVFGPSGLLFSAPARLTLPYALPEGRGLENLYVQVEEEDGRRFVVPRDALSVDTAGGTLSFGINGFTAFQSCSGAAQACNSNANCAAGYGCVNGYCHANQHGQDGGAFDGGHGPFDGGHSGMDGGGNFDGGHGPFDGGQGGMDGGGFFDGGHSGQDGGQGPKDGGQGGMDGGGLLTCTSNAQCPNMKSCINGICQ